MSKKVSIIMLTYNGEKYLREAIDSCLNQTYTNTEVNIIDDCSTDGTIKILKSYGDKINVTYNETNQGITANVNKLGLSVKSDFIVFLGHDDKLPSQHIELMLSEFDDDIVAVHCNSIIIDGDGKELRVARDDKVQFKKTENAMFELSLDNFINAIGQMIRTEIFQKVRGWDSNYRHYGDWTLLIKELKYGKIKYTTKTKSYYRIHTTNISHTLRTTEKKSVNAWKKTARILAHRSHNYTLIEYFKYWINYFKIDLKIFIKLILGK